YAHAPVKNADPQTLPAALAALEALPKPVLIHCRGGGRATALALVATATQAGLGRDQFVEQVTAQGMALDHPQIQQFLREHYGDPVPPETV
ncbi:MAG TPA: hypothetical protein VLS96_14195, partial [Nodosilinea sp.]|nr:hypothetical protein [Nodosilinea sp.]